MRKAVLIMDMPKGCDNCRLSLIAHDSDLYEEGECFCVAGLESVDCVSEGSRPDWCPLRELPEKNFTVRSDAGNDYRSGWDACLDQIAGTEE